jgi:murein DD-endopeptidase MepM/ murein hydrolase activator NlpD
MSTYIRPVQSGISDNFAAHKARRSVNPGTDYVVGVGTPVVAIADGVVTGTVTHIGGAGGRMIFLGFPDGHNADYLHLARVDVSPGQTVKQGQVIGLSGASGRGYERGYGPHLHLSFRHGGRHTSGTGNKDFEAVVSGGGAPAPAAVPASKPTVKKGSKGKAVAYLQSKLGITADGAFGPITDRSVRAFQASKGLVVDGIVGPKTWAAIG